MANLNIDLNLVVKNAQASLGRLENQAKGATNSLNRMEGSVKGINSGLKLLSGVVAGIGLFKLTQSVFDLAGASISSSGNLETLSTQFEVLTGSSQKATKVMSELVDFTAKTPFQLEGVAKAGQRLISFGFEVDSIQDKLQTLGDVSAASGADLGEMALIFGQVRAAGKLTGERLLQLQERAIPIGPALAKTMGVAESAVRDMVSQGKVDFETFEKAFESLNDKGEFAFEGMIKRSRTLEGRASTLKDNLNLLGSDVGNQLLPSFKGLITAATVVIDRLRKSGEVAKFFGNIVAQIPGIIGFMSNTLITFNNIIQETRKFLNVVRAGFNAFASGAIDMVVSLNEAEISVKKFLGVDTSPLEAQNKKLLLIKETLSEVAVESLASNRKIEESQNATNQAISDGSKFLIKAIDDEISAAKKQAESHDESNQKVIDSEKRLTQEQLAEIEQRRQAAEKLAEQLDAARKMTAEQKEATRLFDMESEQIFQEERLIALQDYFDRETEATIQSKINLAETETEKQLLIEQAQAKGLANRRKARIDADKKEAEDRKKKQQDLIKDRRDTGAKIATLASSNNKTLATIGKAAAITQIAIDGPAAITKALAAFPPPFNFAAAALVGAAVAQQAANVAGVSFATGGFVGGDTRTGDRRTVGVNSGEAILNTKQQKNFMDLANGAAGGSKEIVIRNVIELDGQQITESVSRHVADGFELGEIV